MQKQNSLFDNVTIPDPAKIFAKEKRIAFKKRKQERLDKGEIAAPVAILRVENKKETERQAAISALKPDSSLMAEVLQPRPEAAPLHPRVPRLVPSSEDQKAVLKTAAEVIRDIYLAGRQPPHYYEGQPDARQAACADVECSLYQLYDVIDDDKVLAVAEALYHRAGLTNGNAWPTKPSALAQMQMHAVDQARKLLPLFANQESFSFH